MSRQDEMDVDMAENVPVADAATVTGHGQAQTDLAKDAAPGLSISSVQQPYTAADGPQDIMDVDVVASAQIQEGSTEVTTEQINVENPDESMAMQSTTIEETTALIKTPHVAAQSAPEDAPAQSTIVVEQTTTTITETTAEITENVDAEQPSELEKLVEAQIEEPSNPAQQALVLPLNPAENHIPLSVAAPTIPKDRVARTGYIFDHLMMLHCMDGYTPTADTVVDTGNGHPEEPMRIKRIFQRLADQHLIKRMKKLAFSQVTMEQACLVHTQDHWDKVQGTEVLTDQYIQESKAYYDQLSLYVCRETAQCARLSCGGVIQACRSVCQGEVRNAFAIVRPPGHHAEPDEHMGFCFFNNAAVAARAVQQEGLAKKVLILDWDVHHGNGTQRAFWTDPSVLYISIHRHDGGAFYPTSDFGALDMVGEGAGEGTSVNIPWPGRGFGDADYIYAFQKIVMPIAYEFNPDLVIVSAGFDAAEGDVLGGCRVTPAAYGHMTHMLCALAGGRVVVALEGGYNLEAISRSSLAVAQVLLGETPAELGPLQASEDATEVVHQVAQVQSKYWKSIDVSACQPPEVAGTADENLAIAIPDLLKIHRAHHLFTKHQLFQIPLASSELEDAFGGQVTCSEGVYEAGKSSVLVVFVHDFGNLRVEIDRLSTVDVHAKNSYILDTSDKVLDWVRESGYNIIDVNTLAQIPTNYPTKGPRTVLSGPELEGQLMKYIWDNYIELSEAENVVLIGHGTGCGALMELVNSRDVDRKVKAIVQVGGMHSMVRIDDYNENRRGWFTRSCRTYLPKEHPILTSPAAQRKLGSQVFTSEKAKVVDVLVDVFPKIQEFVTSMLPGPAVEKFTNGTTAINGYKSPSPAAADGPVSQRAASQAPIAA